MAALFILIARGWTILFENLEAGDEFFIPIIVRLLDNFGRGAITHNTTRFSQVLLFALHVLIVVLSKLSSEEDSDSHHAFTGWVGGMIVALRLAMFTYFSLGVKEMLLLKIAQEQQRIKQFLWKFFVFGALYFLAFPALLLLARTVPEYEQNKIIVVGTIFS